MTSNLISHFNFVNTIVQKYGATLVAVSKKKPIEDIKTLYSAGQLQFGENYIQELETKARALPKDIQWHFIGHLQSNKCKVISDLVQEGYSVTVQTIDTIKLARKLNNSLGGHNMNVFVQVNTSQEDSKSGLKVQDCKFLVEQILTECKRLNLIGLMCIGAPNQPIPNPDFVNMNILGKEINQKFNLNLKYSFGMSDDFEHALEMKSGFVRVGSKIFGNRDK